MAHKTNSTMDFTIWSSRLDLVVWCVENLRIAGNELIMTYELVAGYSMLSTAAAGNAKRTFTRLPIIIGKNMSR